DGKTGFPEKLTMTMSPIRNWVPPRSVAFEASTAAGFPEPGVPEVGAVAAGVAGMSFGSKKTGREERHPVSNKAATNVTATIQYPAKRRNGFIVILSLGN